MCDVSNDSTIVERAVDMCVMNYLFAAAVDGFFSLFTTGKDNEERGAKDADATIIGWDDSTTRGTQERIVTMDKPSFPSASMLAPARVWEAFLHDGREILHVAQLVECGPNALCAEAVDYAMHMTSFAGRDELLADAATEPAADVRRKHLPGLVRALFSKHARTHRVRLSEAIDRWLPKLRDLYGEEPTKPVLDLLDEIEWEWDE